MIEVVKRNSHLIMFVLMMILLMVLAYWISERLIQHLDQTIPHLGDRIVI
jgi:hypothetical protein